MRSLVGCNNKFVRGKFLNWSHILVPANAVFYNGQVVTYNGQMVTYAG